jgi:hypothetical protein
VTSYYYKIEKDMVIETNMIWMYGWRFSDLHAAIKNEMKDSDNQQLNSLMRTRDWMVENHLEWLL